MTERLWRASKKRWSYVLFINARAAVPVSGIIFLWLCDLSCPSQSMSCLCLFFFLVIFFTQAQLRLSHSTYIFSLKAQGADFTARLSLAGPCDHIVTEYHTATLAAELLLKARVSIDPVAQCWYEGGNAALQWATATRCHVTFIA